MFLNKRGAALLQVLIVSALLAGMATMILRATLSRTLSARQARHSVFVQKMVENCMGQVSRVWAAKTPEAYARDLAACQMCDTTADDDADCPSANVTVAGVELEGNKVYQCGTISIGPVSAPVFAVISDEDGDPCTITYVVPGVADL